MKLSIAQLRRIAALPADACREMLLIMADNEEEAEDRRRKDAERKRTKRGNPADTARKSDGPPPPSFSPTPPHITTPSPTVTKQTRARLPENWHPSEEHWTKARDEWGIAEATLKFETSHFRDHWLSSGLPTARKMDWGRAWLNWMRPDSGRGRGAGGPAPPRRENGALTAVRDQLREIEERDGEGNTDFDFEPRP